jgi:hypothetical protein
MAAFLIVLALAASVPTAPTKVELLRRGAADSPFEIALARDKWLDLKITLTVPTTDRDIEGLEIMAENLMPGYWDHRQPPNLFVTIERLDASGSGKPARARVLTSGGGQDFRQHFKDVMIELLDTPENREKRIRDFIAKHIPLEQMPGSIEAVVRALEQRYIGNPVGKYRVEVEYRESGRPFAHRTVLLRVDDGPDSLDDLAAKP